MVALEAALISVTYFTSVLWLYCPITISPITLRPIVTNPIILLYQSYWSSVPSSPVLSFFHPIFTSLSRRYQFYHSSILSLPVCPVVTSSIGLPFYLYQSVLSSPVLSLFRPIFTSLSCRHQFYRSSILSLPVCPVVTSSIVLPSYLYQSLLSSLVPSFFHPIVTGLCYRHRYYDHYAVLPSPVLSLYYSIALGSIKFKSLSLRCVIIIIARQIIKRAWLFVC